MGGRVWAAGLCREKPGGGRARPRTFVRRWALIRTDCRVVHPLVDDWRAAEWSANRVR